MTGARCLFAFAMLATFAWLQSQSALANPIERVSVASDGTQQNGAGGGVAGISANGRVVVFRSDATNLVAGDTNLRRDVFVHDRQTHLTDRVSIASGGTQGNDDSDAPAVNADGRYVVFSSTASNLVAGDTNGVEDVFVHDRVAHTTERLSVASGGAQGNGISQVSSIHAVSADGRFVVFRSLASNLVTGDTNGAFDVFLRDRQTGQIELVSVASDGARGNNGSSTGSISADGRFVLFYSSATNFIAGDTNGVPDVFVRDRAMGTTELVSVTSGGSVGNGQSLAWTISADGRFAAFRSAASDLVTGDSNGHEDVLIRDLSSFSTELVSVASDGSQGNGFSNVATVSADGSFVAFDSMASNLVAGDSNGRRDVFVRDRSTLTTERVSIGSDGAQGALDSQVFDISADGRFVVVVSANPFVAGDTNGVFDVFVVDRGPVTYTVSVSASPVEGGLVGGGGTFAEGTSQTVTATPNEHYTFVNWTEGGTEVSTDASYTFTLTGDRTLVANFAQITHTIALSAEPPQGGTVQGAGSFPEGSSQTVIATASSGYSFALWHDGSNIVSVDPSYTCVTSSEVDVAKLKSPAYTAVMM